MDDSNLSLREKIKQGEVVFGSFVKMTDVSSTEIFGLLNYDFIIVDNEHVAMNPESIVNIIRSAENVNLDTIVRVRDLTKSTMLQVLDSGATGVQVPNVDNADEAKDVVNAVKYHPIGKRGYAPSHRAAKYSLSDKQEYLTRSNQNTLTVIHCESKECIENLDDILNVKEIDIIFIGPMDLSQAFGVPGNPADSQVQHAFKEIVEKVKASDKAIGTVATSVDEAIELMHKGYQYIAISSDQGFIIKSAKQAINRLQEEKSKINGGNN